MSPADTYRAYTIGIMIAEVLGVESFSQPMGICYSAQIMKDRMNFILKLLLNGRITMGEARAIDSQWFSISMGMSEDIPLDFEEVEARYKAIYLW